MDDTPVTLQKATLDRFLKHKRSADLIALYTFYIYTGNWQGTNQPKATTGYTAKGLGWGVAKVRTIKAILVRMGLIEDLAVINPLSRKAEGWFIHVIHFPRLLSNHPINSPECGSSHTVESNEANACSTNKGCADKRAFFSTQEKPVSIKKAESVIRKLVPNRRSAGSKIVRPKLHFDI